MILASSFVTLAACATASPSTDAGASAGIGAEPNPVIVRTVETRRVCPAELDQPAPTLPAPPPGAVVRHNAEGGAWLDALIAAGQGAIDLFNDARAACPPGDQ